jgi:hypothetical protein
MKGVSMYWRYWKRGWWSWLMQLSQNLICLILFFILAMVFGRGLAYFVSASLVGLVVLVPLMGWLFEAFAANSQRISQHRQDASKSRHCASGAERTKASFERSECGVMDGR